MSDVKPLMSPLSQALDVLQKFIFGNLPDAFQRSDSADLAKPYLYKYRRSGAPVSIQDLPGLYAKLPEHDAHLALVNNQLLCTSAIIAKLRQVEEGLRARGKQISASRAEHLTHIRCHIKRLPLDILADIFVHCLTDDFTTPRKAAAPMLLTQVCCYWRALALVTPRLWSSLSIEHTRWKFLEKTKNVEFLKTWLQRAGQRPISLCLDWGGHARQLSAKLKYVLRPYRTRCTRLKLGYGTIEFRVAALRFFPNLKHLDFDVSISTTHSFEPFSQVFPEFAQLKHVSLHIKSWYMTQMADEPTWPTCVTNIEVAITSHVKGTLLLRFLRGWSSITHLTCLYGLDSDRLEDVEELRTHAGDPQTHPRLQVFTMPIKIEHVAILLDALTLPRLRKLDIEVFGIDGRWPHARVLAFLLRSACSLQHFTLTTKIPVPIEQWAEYRRVVPTLTSCELKRQ